MNEYVIVGAGAVGSAAAAMILGARDSTRVALVDRRVDALQRAASRWAATGRLHTDLLDLDGTPQANVRDRIASAAIVICAVDRDACEPVFEACLEYRVPVITLDRPEYDDIPALSARFRERGGRAVLAGGLEPGLAEMGARWAAAQLDCLDELALQCGGIPRRPVPPLGYRLVFDGARLPFEMRPTYRVEAGRLERVPRFSEIEPVDVPGIGRLEAFHDGLVPTLPSRMPFASARTITQKTLRWPGYAESVATLHRLGLLGRTPVIAAGTAIAPEDFVYQVLAPQLQLRADETDLVVLRVVARGIRAGIPTRAEVQLVDEARDGMTAMARTTGFTAALIALATAEGALELPPGVWWPDEVIHGLPFLALLDALRATGVSIRCEAGTE